MALKIATWIIDIDFSFLRSVVSVQMFVVFELPYQLVLFPNGRIVVQLLVEKVLIISHKTEECLAVEAHRLSDIFYTNVCFILLKKGDGLWSKYLWQG